MLQMMVLKINEAMVTITVQPIADSPSDFVLLAPVDDTIIEINSKFR